MKDVTEIIRKVDILDAPTTESRTHKCLRPRGDPLMMARGPICPVVTPARFPWASIATPASNVDARA